jgi:hypothetical protein
MKVAQRRYWQLIVAEDVKHCKDGTLFERRYVCVKAMTDEIQTGGAGWIHVRDGAFSANTLMASYFQCHMDEEVWEQITTFKTRTG